MQHAKEQQHNHAIHWGRRRTIDTWTTARGKSKWKFLNLWDHSKNSWGSGVQKGKGYRFIFLSVCFYICFHWSLVCLDFLMNWFDSVSEYFTRSSVHQASACASVDLLILTFWFSNFWCWCIKSNSDAEEVILLILISVSASQSIVILGSI